MCDLLNPRLPKALVPSYQAIYAVFANVPTSFQSNSKNLFFRTMRLSLINSFSQKFKKNAKDKELKVELIFFIVKDYKTRDVDNLIKLVLDGIQGYWYDDDGQIKIVHAEKYKVKDIDKSVNPKLYEQIYCAVSILEN